jgi:hypothetical protein
MIRTVECLRTVVVDFPGKEENGDWVCTICFEGETPSVVEDNNEAREKEKGTSGKKCCLPCGHQCRSALLIPVGDLDR